MRPAASSSLLGHWPLLGLAVLLVLLLTVSIALWAGTTPAGAQDGYQPDSDLIEDVWEYAKEMTHGPDHVLRWMRVLKTLGAIEDMSAAKAQEYADQYSAERWDPVVAELEKKEAAPGDYQPDQEVVEDVEGYAGETGHGFDHVLRWMRVLKTLGAIEDMSAAKAQEYADRYSAERWDPVVAELEKKEASTSEPDPTPTPEPTPEPPPAPVGLTATGGDTTIDLSWTDPSDSAITGYQVRMSADGGTTWDPDWSDISGSGASTTSHTLTGLTNDTEYTIELRAVRGATSAGPAASATATPRPLPPPTPAGLSATGGDTDIDLSWTDPSDTAITKYQFRVSADGGTTWNPDWSDISSSGSATTSHTLTGLSNDTDYTIELRAVRGATSAGPAARATATPESTASSQDGYEPDPELIANVWTYARETEHGFVHQLRWLRVLQTLGAIEGMTAAQAQENADRHLAERWDPVVVELEKLENAPGDYEPDQEVVEDVEGYAKETGHGFGHQLRWMRVLHTLGAIKDMSAAEAQGYADQGWERWDPVAAELAEMEAATPPNRAPVVNTQTANYSQFTGDSNAPRGIQVWKKFRDIFSDPDGDELTYTASIPDDRTRLVESLDIHLAVTNNRGEKIDMVFILVDADDDWKAVTPELPDPLITTVTLMATDPGGLSASVSGDFVTKWAKYPALVSATASYRYVRLTFDQEMQASPAPAPGQFTVKVVKLYQSVETVAVSSVSVIGAVVTLDLASDLEEGQPQDVFVEYVHDDDAPLTPAGGGHSVPGFTSPHILVSPLEPTGEPGNFAADYDLDDDGLIEVSTLAQLNAIRWDADGDGASDGDNGVAIYSEAFAGALDGMGCPDAGCVGYELTASLDFDTNGNGKADSGDTYWNDGRGWSPIPEFRATFDGGGHTISNLYSNQNHSTYPSIFDPEWAVGLFSICKSCQVKGLGLLDVNVNGGQRTAGALIAKNRGGHITESYATGSITNSGFALSLGGLVGDNTGGHCGIVNSYANVTVTGSDGSVGGLVGRNGDGCSINSSWAAGLVTGGEGGFMSIGGLVGSNRGVVFRSYATGDVDAESYNVGGLVGTNGGSIAQSYATGNVDAENYNVGGLVGTNGGSIAQSYATGNVDAENYNVGGLVGANGGSIAQSYAIGSVWDTASEYHYVGGLVGDNYAEDVPASVADSYWNTQTGRSNSAGGEGKTTAELQEPTGATGIYANWSEKVWDFGTDSEYPVFAPSPEPVLPPLLDTPGQPGNLYVSGTSLLDLGQGVKHQAFAIWTPVDRASSYKLTWRRPDEGFQPGNEVVTTKFGAEFTASDDGHWMVRLQGCNEAGCGPGIEEMVDFVPSYPSPKLPSNLTVSGESGELSLNATWSAVNGASSYNLRWRQESDSGFQSENEVTVTDGTAAFSVAQFGLWVVQVEACNDAGCGPTASLPIVVSADAAPMTPAITPVCDRTPEVRDLLAGHVGKDCADITAADLAEVGTISTRQSEGLEGLASLKSGDFDGLYNLEELIFSDHQLTTLPEDIFDDLHSLQELEMSIWHGPFGGRQGLTALPEDVFAGLSNLKELDLTGNRLRMLPDGVFDDLSSLQTLNLEITSLTALPEDVFDGLSSLQTLILQDNELSTLPDGVFDGLSSLQTLNLHGNDLAELPDGVFDGLSSLQTLELGSNERLTTLPEDAFDGLSSLQTLDLSYVELTALPEDVFDGLSSLQTLNLDGNDLSTLPEDVFDGLSNLHTLNLDDNDLTTALPVDVFNGLSSLQTLNLAMVFHPGYTWRAWHREGIDLTALPEDLFEGLFRLQRLDLGRNGLRSLPEDVFDGLSSIQTLNLEGSYLTELPEDVFDGLSNLHTLNLQSSDLTELPEDVFDGLSTLHSLDLSHNYLTELPEDVFDGLDSLQTLDLRSSDLSELSAGYFDGLTNLQELNLSYSNISELSDDVFNGLTNLQELDLSQNALTTLLAEMFNNLPQLRELNLSDNPGSPFGLNLRSGILVVE